ncbi:hypothetical protein [Amycolatopsis minnesotensis]|uniref:Uncharacterized protein n=1 Tax=Amycolatopsis minnesotensis TaxID=337894 RepID=A0ABN2R688_9PSEU
MIKNGEFAATGGARRPCSEDRIEHAKDAIDTVLHALARHGGTGETVIVGEVAQRAGTTHETASHLVRAVVMGLSQVDSARTGPRPTGPGRAAVATMSGTRVTTMGTVHAARPRRRSRLQWVVRRLVTPQRTLRDRVSR